MLQKNRLGVVCIILIMFSFLTAAFAGQPEQKGKGKFALDRIIVKFKSHVTPDDIVHDRRPGIKKLKEKFSVKEVKQMFPKSGKNDKLDDLKETHGLTRIHLLKVPQGTDIEQMVLEYSQDSDVEYAEPDYEVEAALTPNDTYYSSNQWDLNNTGQTGGTADADIDAPEAWNITTGNSSVIIAVVDTGVQLNHPDLSGKMLSGYDFVNSDSDPSDDNGHGTLVAGIAAANSNNSTGVAGVCWNCSIMPVKVMAANGSGSFSNVANGTIYAADHGAHVINLSLAGSSSSLMSDAVLYAYNAGVVVVAGMGNDGGEYVKYPAGVKEAISVGATDHNDARASYSNYAYNIDVAAPGDNITSTYTGSSFGSASGTSLATPHVAGLAGLIRSQHPTYTPDQVKWHIENGADDKGTAGWDKYYGWGRINAYNSLQSISPGLTFSTESVFADSYDKGVTPSSGTASVTTFTYKTIYFDDNNSAPSYVQVCIDGTCQNMSVDGSASSSLRDGNYTNGEQYVYTTTLSAGSHDYYFITSNGSGTKRIPASGTMTGPTVTADTTPPTGTISINSGAASTNSTSITLTLSCIDSNGCAQMQFSNDNTTWSTAETYTTSKAWTLSTGDGTKTAYVKFKDTAGNWSTATISDTIVLDTTAPATTASPAAGTYNSTQSVTLTCIDGTGSGCDKIYYTTDGSTPSTLSTVYTTPIIVSASKTLKFFAKDLAGNSETVKSEAYTIDTTAPTGTISINSGGASTNITSVTLTLSCIDANGCAQMQFSNDNSSWSTPETYGTSKTWTLSSGDGTKTVYAKFKDTAGNWSTAVSDTIILDTTAPITTSSPAGGTYNSTQSVTLTCSDGTGSGCDKIYYTTDGTTPTTASTIYATAISVSTTQTLKFFAKDLAGNSETVKTQSYTIDTTAPTGTITINSGAASSSSTSVTLTLSCTDTNGCTQMQFSNDNTNWSTADAYATSKAWTLTTGDGTKTVYVKFKDTAGNWSTDIIIDTIDVVAANTAPTFAIGNGKITTDFGGSEVCYSVTVQADGKILAAGNHQQDSTTTNYFALARYNVDGSLDASFDTDGKVTTAFDASNGLLSYGRSVTVQSDGKILVAGDRWNGFSTDFALARYNIDGSLDTSFDTDGKVTTNFGTNSNYGYSVTLQSDGKILVAGYGSNGSNYDFALVRYNTDGSLDTSFGTGGKATTAIGAGHDLGYSITVQADGKILVAGYSSNGSNYNFALVRYNTDGSLDTGFDSDGMVTTSFGTGINSSGHSVTVQSDSKILVAGTSINTSGWSYDFALARYNANGSLDASFGTGGKVTTGFGSNNEGRSVTLQSDGKILVAGGGTDGSNYLNNNNFALARYNTDGSLDTSFGTGGKVTTAIVGYDQGFSVTLQSDGKILVAGYGTKWNGSSYSSDFTLARYNADGSLDTHFNLTTTLNGTPTYNQGGAAVVLDSDVQIYDTELAAASNYGGASLMLVRNGGANAQDVFSNSGTLGTLTQGGNLTVGGTPIGTVTTNSGGTLTLTFSGSATQNLVNSAMQQIAYSNSSSTPPASAQINWTFNDGNTGAQGTGGALAVTGSSTTVSITSVAPVASLSTSTLTFSNQNVSSTSTAQTVTLNNTGTATLNISSIAASGDYARTTTCGATLAAGANCTINVTFTPTAAGSRTGAVTITSDAPSSPNTVSLSGTGVADTTPPTGSISINSGAASTNYTTATLTLSCTDTSGCAQMQFSNDNSSWSTPETYGTSKTWTLSSGDGTKTVYVKFKDGAGNWSTAYNNTITLITLDAPPSKPANIDVAQNGVKGELLVSWSNPSDADFNHIHIYRSTASGTLGTLIADNVTGIKYTDTGLASLTTYYYTVRAVDNAGQESTNTNATANEYGYYPKAKTLDATPPAVPTGVTATDATTGGKINLSWTNPTDSDLSMIKVYRSTASGTLGSAVFIGLATSYSDTGLTNGMTYYYTVRAVDTSSNETTNTTQVSATATAPDTTPAGTPGSVIVNNTTAGGTVAISWTNPIDSDFAYIRIYRSTTSGQLGTRVYDNVTGTSKTDTGLTNNATYYYTIRSVDTAGNESTNTNQVSGMPTDIQAPASVLGLTATLLSSGQIKLDWTRSVSSDINAYNIYSDNGTGTIDYTYANKVGTVQHPTTTWTSGSLTVGTRYEFAVRAEDAAQNEEANTNVVVSIVPVSNSADGSERAYVSTPKTGRKIGGSRITVVADLLTGTAADVASVSFEYKPASSGSWTAITPSDASFSNPDTTRPWFIHWDVTGLSNGDYLLRAVANNGSADPNPEYVTVTVDNGTSELSESPNGGLSEKSEKVSANTDNRVSIGAMSGLTTLTVPTGALDSDTKVTVTVSDTATQNTLVPSGYGKGNEFREVILDSGQTSLSNNKTAEIVIPYRDDDNDGIVDGTTTKVYDLKVMRYNTSTSSWDKLDSVVDTTNKTVKGKTSHFTLFGLLAPPNPTTPGWNIVAVPLNPSPNSASTVFGQTPYVYNPTTQAYDRPSTIQPGVGYWIKGGANLTATGTETPTTGNFSINIKKGWNMIGNPFRFNVKLSDMSVNYNSTIYTMSQAETNGYLIGTVYPYVSGVYQFVNASDGGEMEPWVGYWILSDKDSTLLVPPTPAQ